MTSVVLSSTLPTSTDLRSIHKHGQRNEPVEDLKYHRAPEVEMHLLTWEIPALFPSSQPLCGLTFGCWMMCITAVIETRNMGVPHSLSSVLWALCHSDINLICHLFLGQLLGGWVRGHVSTWPCNKYISSSSVSFDMNCSRIFSFLAPSRQEHKLPVLINQTDTAVHRATLFLNTLSTSFKPTCLSPLLSCGPAISGWTKKI